MMMIMNKKDWDLVFDRPAPAIQVESALDLGQAIERLFKFPDDGISIVWYGEAIRVPYAYGLSDALDDILEMLEALSTVKGNEYRIAFSPSEPGGLDTDWSLSWEDDVLIIEADWRSALGGLRKYTVELGRLRVPKHVFVNSWLNVLRFLCEATSEVKLEHDEEVHAIRRLDALFKEGVP